MGIEVLLLGFIAACLAVITVLLLTTYTGILRVLQQLQEILPTCKKTLHEAHGALHASRQILSRANEATATVEKLVQKGCQAASETLDQFLFFKKKAVSLLGNRLSMNGNGARHGSRR